VRERLDLVRGGPAALNAIVLLAVLAPLAYVGYRATYGFGIPLDDEGYFLISLREWYEGGSLYGDVYSQYGPAMFVLMGVPLGLLDVLDTDGARAVHLLLWLATALLTGGTLLRAGRNLPVAAVATGLTFYVLAAGLGQALHPGGLLCLMLIGILALPAFLLPERPALCLFGIAALATAATLMKVNVGGLAWIAIAFSLLLATPRTGRDRRVQVPVCATAALVPFALMADNLSADWCLRYAAVVALGVVALGVVAAALPPSIDGLGQWRALAGGAAAAALASIGVVLVTGTSPGDLVRGVILDPLEFDELITLALVLDPGAPLWGAAGLAGAAAFRWKLAGLRHWSPRVELGVGLVSILAGLAIWVSLAEVPNIPTLAEKSTTAIWVAAPLAWIVAIRPPGRGGEDSSFLRTLVPALAIMGMLQAYPTGGPVGWSMFLLVPVGGLAIADGTERLSAGSAALGRPAAAWRAGAVVAVVGFGAWFVLGPLRDLHRWASTTYDSEAPLELAGASHARLQPAQATQFREAAADLEAECSSFLSLPGFNSFYGWTGTEPPTSLNAGAWPWLLSEERQQRVVEQVEGIDGLCVLRAPAIQSVWSQIMGPPPDRPLFRFIDEDFEVVRVYPGPIYQPLELMKRRGESP
jgi:hypothetical protein